MELHHKFCQLHLRRQAISHQYGCLEKKQLFYNDVGSLVEDHHVEPGMLSVKIIWPAHGCSPRSQKD